MPQSRKTRRARRRRRAAERYRASPLVGASPSTGSRPAPSSWASLPAWSRHPVAAGLALCTIVAVSFYPALFAGFVMDDNIFADSPVIQSWSGIWDIWFSPADIEKEGHYWPVTYTSFWLEDRLWGITPFGTHLVNVLLYMANVLLLWWLLRLLSVPGAWAVAAVFAVHPMHVESVAWAIGRKDLLSGVFYVAAALCWIRSMDGLSDTRDRRPDSVRVTRPGLYLAALGFFAAAMLSKTVAVTLPVALVIVLWWKQGRVTWPDAWRIVPFFLLGLFIGTADLTHYQSPRDFSFEYGFLDRVLIAAQALWFYVGKLVWPTDLAIIYPLWDIDIVDPIAWGYVIASVAVAALLWFGRHRLGRGPLAGALFFVVTLSPVLGFMNFGYMSYSLVAERYAYLAGIGVMAVLVGAAARGAFRLPASLKIGALGALVAVLSVLGKLAWDQSGVYRDRITFYNHIISFNQGSTSVYRNLANALNEAGRPAEGLDASNMAIELRPRSANAHNTRGVALFSLGRLDEAAQSFRHALELDASHKTAHQNMAETRRRQGHFLESIEWYRTVLDLDPEFAAAHAGMGLALFELGQYGRAVESLQEAVSLNPRALPISAHHFLAEALYKQQRDEEAIERYRVVTELDPEHAAAHAGIGYASYRSQRYEDAVTSLQRSVSLKPESPDNTNRHVAIGQAFEALGRTEEAANHYGRGLEIDPRNVTALNSLAWLRFHQQRYEEALDLYETVVEIDEANAQVRINMAATLHYLGRPEEALRSLESALSLDPTLAETGLGEMRDALREERE